MEERAHEQVFVTLKQDLPTLFEQDISYDIYTKDIYFQNSVNKFKSKINCLKLISVMSEYLRNRGDAENAEENLDFRVS